MENIPASTTSSLGCGDIYLEASLGTRVSAGSEPANSDVREWRAIFSVFSYVDLEEAVAPLIQLQEGVPLLRRVLAVAVEAGQ